MKKYIPILALLLLVLVSAANILIKFPVSSDLETKETKDPEGRVIRIDYVDDNGRITTVSDKGYATIVRTYEDSKMVKEEYFDRKGKRTLSASEFSVLCRSYNAEGRADTDTYFGTDEEPVKSVSGAYGYGRVYDAEGRSIEGYYIDKSGRLMNNMYGVAVIRREFYENGRIKREFYFDRDGAPAKSHTGQYGEYREYNDDGRISLIIYLGPDGKPFRSSRGCAAVRNVYDNDGKLYEVTFYDENDNPATGRYGQYGERYADGQTIYLGIDGQPVIRLDNYLNTHPAVVIILGICIICLALFSRGGLRYVLAVDYVIFILFMTLWYRESGDTRSRLDLFWSYRQFITAPNLRQSIINNIWLFVPLGAFLYKPGSRRFLIPVILSVMIEGIQYFTGIGLCELDDVLSNTIGGLIGYSLSYFYKCYVMGDLSNLKEKSGAE